MKRKIYLLGLMLLMIFFTGCGKTTGDDGGSAEPVKMTDAEITWFEEEFFNRTLPEHMENMFLTSEYSTVKDIDLYMLFYNGVAGGAAVTKEEKDAFWKDQELDLDFDVFKITADQMNDCLKQYAGISLEDSGMVNITSFFYREDTDAYYTSHTDTNAFVCSFSEGIWTGDGYCLLTYEDPNSYPTETKQVKMKVVDKEKGLYQFVSNVKVSK